MKGSYCCQLLFDERFTGIEKIKIVGSTYMAACGLSSIVNLQSIDSIASDDWSFVKTMAHFAAAMRNVLQSLNRVKSKNFQLRIGKNIDRFMLTFLLS